MRLSSPTLWRPFFLLLLRGCEVRRQLLKEMMEMFLYQQEIQSGEVRRRVHQGKS